MIRKLPNLSLVLSADSRTHPWKVERRERRIDHPDRETFIIVRVGRYCTKAAAYEASKRSAQRSGGNYLRHGVETKPIGAEARR